MWTGMSSIATFGEVAEILDSFERTDTEVRSVSVIEKSVQRTDEISADLTVGVPLFEELEFDESVSIESNGVDLLEEAVELDVTVSVTVEETSQESVVDITAGPQAEEEVSNGSDASESSSFAYKDPEKLRDVYEQFDTFPQMTEALGVDVTSETVRRYMVQYGIHDPDQSPIQSDITEDESTTDAEPETEPAGTQQASDGSTDREAGTGPDAETDSNQSRADSEGLAELPVTEAILTGERSDADEVRVTDGVGIPGELTIGQLGDILNDARTVSEVKSELGIEYEQTRRLLSELNLMPFINGRLSTPAKEIELPEIHGRITNDHDTSNG
jgi:hypothetical protein